MYLYNKYLEVQMTTTELTIKPKQNLTINIDDIYSLDDKGNFIPTNQQITVEDFTMTITSWLEPKDWHDNTVHGSMTVNTKGCKIAYNSKKFVDMINTVLVKHFDAMSWLVISETQSIFGTVDEHKIRAEVTRAEVAWSEMGMQNLDKQHLDVTYTVKNATQISPAFKSQVVKRGA